MWTLRDAARELQIDEHALRQLLQTAGIALQADPANPRTKTLTDEDMAMLRKLQAEAHATHIPSWAGDVLRRLQQLEDRVQRLEQRLGLYDEG